MILPRRIVNRLKTEMVRRKIRIPCVRPFLPAVVYIAPTLQCNLDCRMCSLNSNLGMPDRIPSATHFSDEMNQSEWLNLADQLGRFKPRVLLSGGEPLLSPHILPIVHRLSHRWHMQVGIGTNGLFLDEMGADLFRAGATHFYVSVDGIGDVYDSLRGKGNFARMERSLETIGRLMQKYGAKSPEVNAVILLAPQVIPSLSQTLTYLIGRGIRRFSLQHLFRFTASDLQTVAALSKDMRHNPRWTWGERITLAGTELDELADQINRIRHMVSGRNDIQMRFVPDLDGDLMRCYYYSRPMPTIRGFSCPLFWTGTYVYPDGSVFPSPFCHFYAVGNVRLMSFKDIWYGPEYSAIRHSVARNGWHPACGYCMIPYGACV